MDPTGHFAVLAAPAAPAIAEATVTLAGLVGAKIAGSEIGEAISNYFTPSKVSTETSSEDWIKPSEYQADNYDWYFSSDGTEEATSEKHPWNELPTTGDRPFNPPVDKAGNELVKRGTKGGRLDKDGNVWKLDKGSQKVGKPHWDVQHPDGSHTNVNPKSSDNPGGINHGADNF